MRGRGFVRPLCLQCLMGNRPTVFQQKWSALFTRLSPSTPGWIAHLKRACSTAQNCCWANMAVFWGQIHERCGTCM